MRLVVDIITGLAGLVFAAGNDAGVTSGVIGGGVGELATGTAVRAGATGVTVVVVVAAVSLALAGPAIVGIVATGVVGEFGTTGALCGVAGVVAVGWARLVEFADAAAVKESVDGEGTLPLVVGVAVVALVAGAEALDDEFPGVGAAPLALWPAEAVLLSVDCWAGGVDELELEALAVLVSFCRFAGVEGLDTVVPFCGSLGGGDENVESGLGKLGGGVAGTVSCADIARFICPVKLKRSS